MKAIIAVNRLGFIGLNGELPWGRCKADLKHFKEMTKDCHVLVGKRTNKTLPPLPGRIIHQDDWELHPNLIVELMGDGSKNVWCIGGKITYERYMPYFTELHISHIVDDTLGDTMLPNFSTLPTDCKIFHYFFHPSDDGKNFES